MSETQHDELRVLMLASMERDAELMRHLLEGAGLQATAVDHCTVLCDEMIKGVGAVILTGETLDPDAIGQLHALLAAQPAWSDIPLFVFEFEEVAARTSSRLAMLEPVANLTVLERPIRATSLISALRSALRARERQYAVRDHLRDRDRLTQRLQRSNDRLQLLSEATASLMVEREPDWLIKQIFERLGEQLGLDAFFHYAMDDSGSLRLETYGGVSAADTHQLNMLSPDVGLCADWELTHRPDQFDLQNVGDLAVRLRDEMGITAYTCQPLLAENRCIGAICFASRSRTEFEPDEVELMRTVSDQIAVALRRRKLITDLKNHAEQVEESTRLKDQFLAMLGHELRNPLAAITMGLRVMGMTGPGDPAYMTSTKTVQRQAEHMSRLVDDLLDVSRVSRGLIELRKQPIEVAATVRGVIDALITGINERRHHLEMRLPDKLVWLEADPARFHQILENLLTNAIKYTEFGGRIVVEAIVEDSHAVIAVEDSGIGIAPHMLPGVFDLFSQAERTLDRSKGGLGIGLTLAKRLVQLHGGAIHAHSGGLGHGSRFVIRMPILKEPDEPNVAESPHVESSGALRVLIVDDNESLTEMTEQLLQRLGHITRVAFEGKTAVGIAHEFDPQLILLDIGLPEMDGYEVAKRLRRELAAPGPLIVAVSGYGQDEDRRRSRLAGFDRHLVKPVRLEALRETIELAHARH